MPDETNYAIVAETGQWAESLCELHIPMARLLEAYVSPYEEGETFLIDGVAVNREALRRFKVVRQSQYFVSELRSIGRKMRHQPKDAGKEVARHYITIFDDLLRNSTVDVTNQLISAYTSEKPTVKPSLAERAMKYAELASRIEPLIKGLID